jgi:hypothetical protein
MEIIIGIVIFVVIVLVLRLFGAWMLRIDEVIALLKDIRELLKHGR